MEKIIKKSEVRLTEADLEHIGEAVKEGFQAGFVERAEERICWSINFWKQDK
jgi:hypothetical protein